jgi:CBS domain-containing protein
MPAIRDILASKGSNVLSIPPDTTALEAAELMNTHRVGGLVVMDGGRVVGMFTERDILTRVVVARRDPGETAVREVMSTKVICCQPQTKLDEARLAMKDRRIRHLPVVGEMGQLLGLISIGDLNAYDANSQESTIHYMEQYIHGRA